MTMLVGQFGKQQRPSKLAESMEVELGLSMWDLLLPPSHVFSNVPSQNNILSKTIT